MRIRTIRLAFSFALVFWGIVPNVNAQPRYLITVLPGNSFLVCGGPLLNQTGQAAFTQYTNEISWQTFLVDNAGTRTHIGFLSDQEHRSTQAAAINAVGQIAGQSRGDDRSAHSFLWTPGVGMVDLASASIACGLNNAGDVVGQLFRDNGPHGFVYTQDQLYDLDTVDIADRSEWLSIGPAVAINDVGQIFGSGQRTDGSRSGYLLTPAIAQNLLEDPGFERYAPPALGVPGSASAGWVSDSYRQIPAKSESNQPRTGDKNGACWSTVTLDCGMYQDFVTTVAGTYTLTFYANADRPGGLIGANINGILAATATVQVRGFRTYGNAYTMTFDAAAHQTISIWMYSPATPGYVVIDDVSLTVDTTAHR